MGVAWQAAFSGTAGKSNSVGNRATLQKLMRVPYLDLYGCVSGSALPLSRDASASTAGSLLTLKASQPAIAVEGTQV